MWSRQSKGDTSNLGSGGSPRLTVSEWELAAALC